MAAKKTVENTEALTAERRGPGRPSVRCDFAVDVILEKIREGDSLEKACGSMESLPSKRSFLRWVSKDLRLEQRWINAMVFRALSEGEECIHIADTCPAEKAAIAKANLRIRTRQWNVQRMQPKRFGRDGLVDENAAVSGLAQRLKAARERVRERV